MNHYVWQERYEAAMLETKAALIQLRIVEAENALLDRIEDEVYGRCILDKEEREAIERARQFLGALRVAYAA